ncbi:hypothetical protein P153DRAFT_342945 [Dothidotthia symphoricarpi CBS 119687]|uniref:Nuclear pore complex protein Nup85 n=1 Tax=Dothidotthia symphoricarpi CBS 119687 TaxID=1392245 RepID=A0A6A6A8R2_9PLEO|nr:uncharacterized protein P153DRAFT_342945 [Dothidotthia symphoricarpi CBS 119687]KAF2127946.1 hypothetical protein P153DRAFT_342945 [Dothidotthia symphoricarpi CBS 119687]
MFRVPSSTPPSTPNSRRQSRSNAPPSTTPAGQPRDDLFYSTSTPAGAPPAMNDLFDNARPTFTQPSGYNFNTSLFDSSPPKHGYNLEGVGAGSMGMSTTGRPTTARGRTTSSGYRVPSSPPRPGDDDEYGSEEGEDDDDMDEYDEYDDDEDDEQLRLSAQRRAKAQNRFSQSVVSHTSASDLEQGPMLVRAGAKQTQFDLLPLAKGLTPNVDRATLQEPDHVILETERLAGEVQASLDSDSPETRIGVLSDIAQKLVASWQAASRTSSKAGASSAAALSNASRLASLLLTLHHPPPIAHNQRSTALSIAPARPEARHFTPIPKVLLSWLNNTYAAVSEVELVLKESRAYSRHPSFWEAVQASAVRGNFDKTLQLLQGAKLENAATAQEDGLGDAGYTGSHLRHANDAVRTAIDLLRECPAVASDDWDVKGHDWSIFRQRTHQAYANLQDFAEGESASRHAVTQPFQASHFGISQSQASFHLSVTSRKAESKVPWSIYENLRNLYQLLLGNEEQILAISADWIEAVLGLAIWWNGEEEDVHQGSLAASRRSLMRSQRVRPVDVTPVKAYCQRLSSALAAVIENSDEDFSVNATDRFEVGIACIVDDNIEGVLRILQGWSLTVASAVAELASAGEWFVRADDIMGQFNQDDLMVLSYNGPQRSGVSKDDLLIAYADLLAAKGEISGQDGQQSREGWELAIQILGRLDDSVTASERVERLLVDLPLESATRVDKITQLCHNMGLSQHALTIALKYADHLRANTQNYGDTLLYYARAHAAPKIQDVLRVLVAHCLIKSVAYPPPADLDPSLASLVTSPKQTLTKLASLDPEAAALLSNHLSGYATLRKYYDLRDEEVLLKPGEKPAHGPMARKRAAANALMVIIASAASSIRGGLYDPEVETVVQVDVLLPLLGEALVFVNQPKRTLTLRHLYDLLAAVEDLDTSSSLIRAQCEEVLATALAAAYDPSSPDTHNALHKSLSNSTAASSSDQYSMLGSMDFGLGQSSAVLVGGGRVDEGRRAWDWRKGFVRGAKGADVVRVLRLGIAREIGRAFVEGEVCA